jgi:hypothetical protein
MDRIDEVVLTEVWFELVEKTEVSGPAAPRR